ncbi:MAG TPA: GNAT family acetyltransferase [Mycobacteriales bacterium]|nr:GNAT family acetyltransferase [Mycobacteriales bacterium]
MDPTRGAAGDARRVIADLPAHLGDAAVVLWQECGLTRPWNDPQADLTRALAGTSSTVLADVTEAGTLKGTAMVGHDGHRAWVYYLAVAPEARGTGLGRALMTACEEWAAARGMPKLMLMVRSDNAAVVAFYERLGYLVEETAVMGRRLDGA